MSKTRISIIALALALLASNALWAYALSFYVVPTPVPPVTCPPKVRYSENCGAAILPLLAAISSSAEPGASRDSIISAVAQAQYSREAFCIEDYGVVRVRGIGLKFDSGGNLVGATLTYCPPY
jgi:hypothetical protein